MPISSQPWKVLYFELLKLIQGIPHSVSEAVSVKLGDYAGAATVEETVSVGLGSLTLSMTVSESVIVS